ASLDSLVEDPVAPEPAAGAGEAEADSLLDAMMAPDDSMSLLRDLEKLGKPPAPKPAPAGAADPAWSFDVPVPQSRMATRFKAAAPKEADAESGALDLGAL